MKERVEALRGAASVTCYIPDETLADLLCIKGNERVLGTIKSALE